MPVIDQLGPNRRLLYMLQGTRTPLHKMYTTVLYSRYCKIIARNYETKRGFNAKFLRTGMRFVGMLPK